MSGFVVTDLIGTFAIVAAAAGVILLGIGLWRRRK